MGFDLYGERPTIKEGTVKPKDINWDTAIGPINIVYAYIIESNQNDTTDNIYFDIGYNF